jgi:TonB-linked SusC/RagA family outer membrane protein
MWAIISSLIIGAHPETQAQEGAARRITGKILTSAGQPLEGASVTIKGSDVATSTSSAGEFAINARTGDVLVVSSVGYQTREGRVGTGASLNFSMTSEARGMDEVVVVGYGRMKRAEQSSAQVSVSAADISKTVNTTVEQALQGRAAGVYVTQNTGQPGGGISVNIRGVNTIGGSNEPLYVIDGIQIQPSTVSFGATASTSPLSSLNPADIESMEVLQGPAATAVYGSRGTNGVVLITTKRGKAGQLKIGYNYQYSLQAKPEILPSMNLQQFAQMTNEIRFIAGNGGQGPGEFRDPSLLSLGTNWQKELFKTSPWHKHQLTLSGGNEATTYYMSGEYSTQEGVAIGSKFDRGSFRLNLDNQTRQWVKLSTNLSVSQTNEALGSTSEGLINTAIIMSPSVAVKNAQGQFAGADETNGVSVQYTPLNPVAIANLIENDLRRSTVQAGLNADVTILKGLIFRASLNGNANWSEGRYFSPNYQIGNRAASIASLSLNSNRSLYWNLNQLLQYNTKLGKHDIGVMVSHESQESRYSGINGSRTGFVSNDVVGLNLGQALGQQNGSNQGSWAMESYLGRINYSYANKYYLQGAFRADGSANFGPENRWGYFPSVSAAWRVSQESFMENIAVIDELKLRVETGLTGNQGNGGQIYSPLSSVGTPFGTGFLVGRYGNTALKWEQTRTDNIGFNLSLFKNRIQLEADFYIKKTDNLLLPNPLPAYMGTSGQGAISTPTVNIGALQNQGVALTMNTVNIDRGGFTWRSNFNISSNKTRINKFYSDVAVIDRQPWYIGTGSTASQGFLQRSAVGQAPWLFYGYQQDGLFQNVKEIQSSARPTKSDGKTPLDVDPNGTWVGDIKYKDLSGPNGVPDGIIDFRDQTIIGNPWPKLTLGFTNSFSYKDFELSVLFTGSFGNDVYNFTRFQNTNPNNINLGRNMLAETFNYAKIEGTGGNAVLSNPDAFVPRLTYNDPNGNATRITDAYVEDGSYVRLKNVTLGYNVPRSVVTRTRFIQGARVAFGIQNLATFTKYKGFDPEVGAYVGQNVGPDNQLIGVDAGRYPLTRVFTFNLAVDF